MVEGAMEKPIDEIRYPNVAKQTRRLMILATVEFVALVPFYDRLALSS